MLLFIRVIFNSCRWCKRFNTSHVTLYLHPLRHSLHYSSSFNTSHVTLYLQTFPYLPNFLQVSIHLMLLFILLLSQICNIPHPVSIHLMLLFIRRSFCILLRVLMFQYISCYSLSTQKGIQEKRSRTFQYISCYSLSGSAALSETRSGVSIHLMLLFINNTLYK